MLLDQAEFLKQLAQLFETTNTRGGSIWLTHKRYTYEAGVDPKVARQAPNDPDREHAFILRAMDGDDVKLSTLVQPSELELFQQSYGTLLKAKMTGHMRKRDKKKEKQRAERVAAKKKRLAVDVVIEGPKRGARRTKRQQRIKAAKKQDAARDSARKTDENKAKKAAASQAAQ
ncbi:signal recognition particle, SRP9/SRP14 subunit [Auriculariales sp. MPI-PUGE-AT-0066]|nr:signal recognition particle, SRP9/SRP14 subunit [Auriculariales sp. MPI-PUGE-AT-0066]